MIFLLDSYNNFISYEIREILENAGQISHPIQIVQSLPEIDTPEKVHSIVCDASCPETVRPLKDTPFPVVFYSMCSKNTVTLSSISAETAMIAVQRVITDVHGNAIQPGEWKLRLTKPYSPSAVMASAAALLLSGKTPQIL